MIKVSILGATGYTGSELLRLLILRSDIEFKYLTSTRLVGQAVSNYYPHLKNLCSLVFTEYVAEKVLGESDVVFVCLPHGHAMTIAKEAKQYPVKVIDLSPDFRLDDVAVYEEYYEVNQTASDLLPSAVYGLTEYNREQIQSADLLANPGCFVTSALLGLLPVMGRSYINPKSIIIDAKSGVSGAGKSATVANLFAELQGNFKAYNILRHRHIPEIEQELQKFSLDLVQVQFTPHLLPIERGIFTTIYIDLKEDVSEAELRELFQQQYVNEKFVHLLDKGQLPEMKMIRGTNNCLVQVQVDKRTHRLIILVVLDNLIKGASGQAIQNMNLMFGLDEQTGLNLMPLTP